MRVSCSILMLMGMVVQIFFYPMGMVMFTPMVMQILMDVRHRNAVQQYQTAKQNRKYFLQAFHLEFPPFGIFIT